MLIWTVYSLEYDFSIHKHGQGQNEMGVYTSKELNQIFKWKKYSINKIAEMEQTNKHTNPHTNIDILI